jgi:DNA polymerase V
MEKILSSFHVSDIWGIGRQISIFLEKNNILTPWDLTKCNDYWIKKYLTIKGYFTVMELRGISCIQFVDEEPDKKTIISSRSFGQPVSTKKELKESVAFHVTTAVQKLRKQNSLCSYIIVYIATNRFKEADLQYSNSKTIKFDETNFTTDIINIAIEGLDIIYKPGYNYKRAGIVLGGITQKQYKNKNLFTEEDFEKKEKLNTAIDYLNSLYGNGSVKSAAYGFTKSWRMKQDMKSPDYTTSWDDLPLVK